MKDDHEHTQRRGISMDELESKYTKLASELKDEDRHIEVLEEEGDTPYYRDYEPGIDDFLARAKTVEECEAIITYCYMKELINEEEATWYREKLKKEGPNTFGSREPGFYDKNL